MAEGGGNWRSFPEGGDLPKTTWLISTESGLKASSPLHCAASSKNPFGSFSQHGLIGSMDSFCFSSVSGAGFPWANGPNVNPGPFRVILSLPSL